MRKQANWLWIGLLAGTLAGQTIPAGGEGCGPALQNALTGLMTRHRLIGGATLAVTQNGQLKAACFAGHADVWGTRPMTATTLMRVASVSKPITAAAIFKLVDQGRLRLDDRVATLLRDLVPANGFADARWNDLTVQHLLHHTGGWDSSATFDPMFRNKQIADLMGERAPATTEVLARYMMRQPLQFAPGSRYVYSNFGFALLGLIVERAGGGSYERYVREEVLAPIGIYGMRIGRSLVEGRTTGMGNARSAETDYIAPADYTTDIPVFPQLTGRVPWQYGGWYLESMNAHGGWVASAPELVRFFEHLDGRRSPAILSPASFAQMTARPPHVSSTASSFYSSGVSVRPSTSGLFHFGAIDGTTAEIARVGGSGGTSFAVLFNQLPDAVNPFLTDIDTTITAAIGQAGLDQINRDLFTTAEHSFQPQPGKPVVRSQLGVVHGASFRTGVVAGSWISIFGANLAGTTRTWRDDEFSGGRLPTQLDGVRVLVNDIPAAVFFISPTQINAQVPAVANPGTAQTLRVRVERNGLLSEIEPVELRPAAPEVFRYFAGGQAFAAATHPSGATVGDPALLGGVAPAQVNGVISVFGTGFAPSTAGEIIRTPVALANVTATLGGQPAVVEYAGLTGAGLFQVNLRIPAIPAGNHPLVLTIQGVRAEVPGLIPVR